MPTAQVTVTSPYTNDEQLKRIDTGAFETAQTGVEYYSPNQHGGWLGTVYRRYYVVPDGPGLGGDVTIPIGVQIFHFIGYGGIRMASEWYCPVKFASCF